MKKNNSDSWAYGPYSRYFDFIAENADRYSILTEHADTLRYNTSVINVEGNRHIFIFPPGQKSLRTSYGLTSFTEGNPYLLCAHYDRVTGSPGANDNSIAVFHLLCAAAILIEKKINNWIIVFTDKEELNPGEKLEEQGSYSLAKKIKNWGLNNVRIFNFDSCGAGEVFILSTTTDYFLKDNEHPNIINLRKSINALRDHALLAADNLRFDKVLLAPTPFSDDAGFLRAGLAAQTVTMLPLHEAEKYEALLRSRPEFADIIISGGVKAPEEKRNLPETWRNLNNAGDIPSRLTPQHFDKTVRFMAELCF